MFLLYQEYTLLTSFGHFIWLTHENSFGNINFQNSGVLYFFIMQTICLIDFSCYTSIWFNFNVVKALEIIFCYKETARWIVLQILQNIEYIYRVLFVLQDLSFYQYDEMVRMSMALLNRYYSSYNHLFTRAVQAQVNITCEAEYVYVIITKGPRWPSGLSSYYCNH